MASSLVSDMTVEELKNVIADVVDRRLNRLLHLLNAELIPKTSEVGSLDLAGITNLLILTYTGKSLGSLNEEQVDRLTSTVDNIDVDRGNPLLKLAGMHKDNPLFDEVIASMEDHRRDSYEEK